MRHTSNIIAIMENATALFPFLLNVKWFPLDRMARMMDIDAKIKGSPTGNIITEAMAIRESMEAVRANRSR